MVQQNALNKYSETFEVGTNASGQSTAAHFLHIQTDQAGTSGVHIKNDSTGADARVGILLTANSGQGSVGMYDDGHSNTLFRDKMLISAEATAAGIVINRNTTGQSIDMTDNAVSIWKMDSSNARTMSSQPCFLAYNSSTDANATGDGTVVTIDFDTEVFDQGGDFASDTFTAPVTGRYLLNVQIGLEELAAAHTSFNGEITTSNRSYVFSKINPGAVRSGVNKFQCVLSVIADMDANDTAYVRGVVSGGTKVVDITGGATNMETCFSGTLLC